MYSIIQGIGKFEPCHRNYSFQFKQKSSFRELVDDCDPKYIKFCFENTTLTLQIPKLPSYRNPSVDFLCKCMENAPLIMKISQGKYLETPKSLQSCS